MDSFKSDSPFKLDNCHSLYLHIPFCQKKCAYCDFYSCENNSKSSAYLQQLIRELDYFNQLSGGLSFSTLYIGGGTPSLLAEQDLEKLFSALIPYAQEGAEISFELNPESMNQPKARILRDYGVKRLSMGIQSLQPRLLEKLLRQGRPKIALQTLEMLLSFNYFDLSVDLLCGIKNQTPRDIIQDLESLLDFPVSHLSLYQLYLEKTGNSDFDKEKSARMLAPQEEAAEIFQQASLLLEDRGFYHYEVSNFARQGKECRHNLAYWHLRPYLGLGPAAVSTLAGPSPEYPAVRLTHQSNLDQYLEGRKTEWGLEYEKIRPRELCKDYLLMRHRLNQPFLFKEFYQLFKIDYYALFKNILETYQQQGFLSFDKQGFSFSRHGFQYLNPFLRDLFGILDDYQIYHDFNWPKYLI